MNRAALIAAIMVLGSTVASADTPTPTPTPTADADSGSGSGSGSDVSTVGVTAPPKQTAAIEPISSTNTLTSDAKPATTDLTTLNVGDVRFELHGYARMPLSTQGTREPYLVDADPFLSGFAYTRLYEPDWSELFFSARRQR